jgi:hypothetical protein
LILRGTVQSGADQVKNGLEWPVTFTECPLRQAALLPGGDPLCPQLLHWY